jgi:tRNA(fMet)-specific endonuclease VapC
MRYLLDTDTCVHFLRGRQTVRERFAQAGFNACAISAITWAELLYGAEYGQNPAVGVALVGQLAARLYILPVPLEAASLFAREKARLRRAGDLIPDFDLLIGCTAVVYDLPLVTGNTRHFARLANLRLEDWTKPR